ncbi:MAG TPA: ion channel [Acidimicrobiia bacterium]|nr:ion channel [Acidimicrobiia bacterium]
MSATERPHRIRDARGAFIERVRRGDSYGLLLGAILAGYVVIALLERSLWERFAISVVLGATFLLALFTSHVRGRGFRVGIVAVAFACLSTLLQALVGRHGNDGSTFIIFLLVLVAPVVILNRILRHETIGTETILGAVCVYVLLGIAFAGVFAAVDDFDHGTFFAQRDTPATNVEFLYFSFITMTTVGYGDLSPATDVGRVIVTFEALLGQVFLVTLVARLVSMYGVHRVPNLSTDLAAVVTTTSDDVGAAAPSSERPGDPSVGPSVGPSGGEEQLE